MITQAAKDQHRICVEFIGTDSENEPGFQARFIIDCSCRGLDNLVSLSGRNASIRIELHLAAHGIRESFTQHPA